MLEKKILADYQAALKAKDSLKSSVLSCLRADIMNAAVAQKKNELDDNGCMAVIKKQIKQHQDSIEQFTQGNRLDLVGKEELELNILKAYLPAQLSEDEVKKIIDEIITSTGANSLKDMGKVMKEVLAKIGASADSKLVSDVVKSRLQ